MSDSQTFVTPAWLAAHLDDPTVVAVEASFFLPDEGKDAGALFHAGHIPGAVRFDIDAVADQSIDLPHMLPDAATFGAAVGALGIGNDTTVVIYDSTKLLGGARAWWMFTHYGAKDIHILDGGWQAWTAGGHPVETGEAKRAPTSFAAKFDIAMVASVQQVLDSMRAGTAQIVDARSATRFAGAAPEPRPGLRAGHMPGARNLPWSGLIDKAGRMRSAQDIGAAFAAAGVDATKPIITTCGSGVSAAVLVLGLHQLGHPDALLYDGSWSEWGRRHDLPIEGGVAK